MTVVHESIWTPSARQCLALRSNVPDLFFGGARGGGKTDFLLADWVGVASAQAGCTGLLLRRTLPELDDVQRRAWELYPRLGAEYKAQSREWHFPNGSCLRMRYLESLQDASRYQGHQYQWIGVDEAGNYASPEVIDLLRGCLRSSRGWKCWMRVTGNPGGPGHDWLKARYITPAPPGVAHVDPETGIRRVFILSKLEDNQHITDPDAYRRNLSGAGPAHLVRAWLHGDWEVLPNGGVLDPGKINRGVPPTYLARKYLSIDGALTEEGQGRGDQTCLTIWAVEGDPIRECASTRHWILAQDAQRWNVTQAADAVMAWCREWDPYVIYIEGGPSGLALKAVLQERMDMATTGGWRIEMVSHAGDKISKATALSDVIGAGRLWVPEGAAFWPAFRDQCTVFDGRDGRKDDRVDSAGIPPRVLRKLAGNKPPKPPAPPVPARRGIDIAAKLVHDKPAVQKGIGAPVGQRSAIQRMLGG
ncbi:MAG: hypothetical protein L6R48_10895 [Planctomycetes bacterium]|nr:hypothetical protein [Planctomycetota bacterium]